MGKTDQAAGDLMFRYFFESKAIFLRVTPQLLILTLYSVLEVKQKSSVKRNTSGIKKEEYISLLYKQAGKLQALILRRIEYQDELNRQYVFLTNNFSITAEEVGMVYKKRWGIELLFKKMKQNFQLTYFYGENENAIRTQVWCTLIAQLLLTVIQKMAKTRKAFSMIATIIRIHLISLLSLITLIQNTDKKYRRDTSTAQGSLFPT